MTDFVHKYSLLYHTCTCEVWKESSKYQYSYWIFKADMNSDKAVQTAAIFFISKFYLKQGIGYTDVV